MHAQRAPHWIDSFQQLFIATTEECRGLILVTITFVDDNPVLLTTTVLLPLSGWGPSAPAVSPIIWAQRKVTVCHSIKEKTGNMRILYRCGTKRKHERDLNRKPFLSDRSCNCNYYGINANNLLLHHLSIVCFGCNKIFLLLYYITLY